MTPVGFTTASVAAHIEKLRLRIASVERDFDHPVELMAVTKGFDGSAIEAAVAAGCSAVGENYAQDLLAKRDAIEASHAAVHFIGRLQRNKVRQLVDLVAVWESLDRASVIDEVASRAPGSVVLIQVNVTGEQDKGGCDPDDVTALVERARAAGLTVDGLMTVGPTDLDPIVTAAAFTRTRSLVDELGLATCSMGMSADLDAAVRAGSSRVRVGSAIFGPRPPR